MRHPRFIPLWATVLGIASLACAQSTRSSEATSPRRLLLSNEIQAASAATAWDAVSRLRPEWLRRRGPTSVRDPLAGEVIVYLNEIRYGRPTSLQSIPVGAVLNMQFLSASEATVRFGTGHGGGVILVRTR